MRAFCNSRSLKTTFFGGGGTSNCWKCTRVHYWEHFAQVCAARILKDWDYCKGPTRNSYCDVARSLWLGSGPSIARLRFFVSRTATVVHPHLFPQLLIVTLVRIIRTWTLVGLVSGCKLAMASPNWAWVHELAQESSVGGFDHLQNFKIQFCPSIGIFNHSRYSR